MSSTAMVPTALGVPVEVVPPAAWTLKVVHESPEKIIRVPVVPKRGCSRSRHAASHSNSALPATRSARSSRS